ncbi:helix-turn-helix domain-containing protein [Gillisia sp. JM1]|uniref:helix-turn-helix domain-containing protein n=1 Tax=Gillisia sp. JM1 TaxID=1283286 RepID=UPI0021CD23A2|nr:helix-turn-helix transcriptional regulator [Gillisia sp. JM1]
MAKLNLKNKWLAEKLNKNHSTISLWCKNSRQSSLETLKETAEVLKVDARNLIYSTKSEKAS